jgi:hypothetical protein
MPKPLRLTLPPLLLLCAACLCVAVAARAQQQQQQLVRETASPAAPGSAQSNLAVDKRGRVYLSWIERLEKNRFALRFATREGAGWSAPRTIAEGANWFVNWADFPSIAALPDGSLAAHWLVKSGPAVYAYDVHVSRSFDGGRSWSPSHVPHRDGTQTEHGFVSMFPAAGGHLAAVWLDGREMKTTAAAGDGHNNSSAAAPASKAAGDGHGHGQMTLRYATLGRARKGFRIEDEALLDARVCECCQTSAALTSEGPVVVYRDRSDAEVRDISIVRLRRDGRWSAPVQVHADNWRLDGCPVNGPSVAASGRRVAVAWFTLADTNTPHVRLAFSRDAGASFSPPVKVDDGDPVGRADVLLLDDGSALVSWIERAKGGAEVRVRRVHPDGRRGDAITVAPSGAARSSGFPQMIRARDRIVFSWTGQRRVLTAEMPVPER